MSVSLLVDLRIETCTVQFKNLIVVASLLNQQERWEKSRKQHTWSYTLLKIATQTCCTYLGTETFVFAESMSFGV